MKELVAGAFLSSFFQVTLERLASVDFIDYFRRGKLEKLVDKLEFTLISINQVLDDAEEKQYKSLGVKKWLGDVKHAMYEADQLLDEIATDARLKKLKVESQPATSNNLFRFFPAFTNPFEYRINELLKNLDSLAEQKDKLELKEVTCARNEVGLSPKPSKREQTTSLVDESGIYGRDGDKEEIIKFLLSENDSGNQVPVISIVGLGGMGKTTLAQLVHNDQRMQEHFELKAWVYVSESFDVIGLTKAILKSFQFPADGDYLNQLQQQLQQRLMEKKYLLVLDDVWNGNEESWEQLLLPFNHGSSGSKIIVTTRDKGVASVMKSTQLLHLQQLEESNCWSLFVKHAFHGRNVSEYPNLESIGKKIVDKCGGLPLAVKTLGNLLRRKFSQREWLKILETDLWCLSDGDNNINPVLRSSYHNLPSNLKRCFAYCSIFPKGYEFRKGEVIKLWMAEGLLKCHRTDKSEEELGNEFFDDLESISFFQRASWHIDYIVMHDLVNDLAKSVSREFCYLIEGDRVHDIPKRTRHIWCSLDLNNDDDRKLEPIYKIKGLRSLIVQGRFGAQSFKICNNVQHHMFSMLKYLRMLSFFDCNLSELADEIGNLKLLRYLDLSWTQITSLPDSICMLHNLQTLVLQNCFKLTELPSDFCKLVNLRHLDTNHTHIKKMPKDIGRLNHLQTMTPPNFVVGEHDGSDIKELAELNHLQGTLRIEGLENVIDPADAAAANLKDKKHLEELCMIYSDTRETDDSIMERDVSVLEVLQPNSNLSGLEIIHYCGSSFPNWLGVHHLPNLVSLVLHECKFCSLLPPLGQLPFLKELSISYCDGIGTIGPEFYDNNSSNVPFRSLEILEFEYMSNWKEWLCLEGFPLLKRLSIRRCPKLKSSLPQNIPSLQELVIFDCQELEASIPKAANISELKLERCEKILVNKSPSSLKRATLVGNRVTESSLEKILFNKMERDVSVLEVLQPNSNLSGLEIIHYCDSSFPNWLGVCHLPNLLSLVLHECKLYSQLPPLGQLPSLKELSISGCHEIEIIGEEFYGNNSSNVPFKSLEILQFKDMSNWKDWLCVEGFPLLKELSISCCPKLKRSLPQNLPSLQKLNILDCHELEASIPKAANINELKLERCEKILVNGSPSTLKRATLGGNRVIESSLEKILFNNAFLEELYVRDISGANLEWSSLDLRCCNSLRTLSISGCSSLPLPLHLFTNLHSLKLYHCPELESFPGGGFPSSLSILEIYNCPKLMASREKWGLFELNSLKRFIVSDDFENVESFPEESLLPPTLKYLELKRCSKLRILNYKGLLHLKSVISLCIEECPCLERLPEEGLPNSLTFLDIWRCSLLEQQYQKEEGERWNTIKHIPSVMIY